MTMKILLETNSKMGYNKQNIAKGQLDVKNISLLVWVTQLGLSVSVPPVMFIWLAVWLQNAGWGSWVLWVGIGLGVFGAISGLISSLRTLLRLSAKSKKEAPPLSFNDHA